MHFAQKSIEMLAERDYTFWKIKQSSTIKNHFYNLPNCSLDRKSHPFDKVKIYRTGQQENTEL